MLADRGRIQVEGSADAFLESIETHAAIQVLPISARIALDSLRLGRSFPRDPVDRLVAATARCHGLRLVTLDTAIRRSRAVAIA